MPDQITLTRDARWLHNGEPITHQRTIELFFKSVLFEKGGYFLTGEKKPVPIQVEDVAFFVRSVSEKSGVFWLQLSNQTHEALDFSTLDLRDNNEMVCRLQSGAPARFDSKAYYQLVKNPVKKHGYFGLSFHGVFYPLQNAKTEKSAPAKPKAVKVKRKKNVKTAKKKSRVKPVKKSVKKKTR